MADAGPSPRLGHTRDADVVQHGMALIHTRPSDMSGDAPGAWSTVGVPRSARQMQLFDAPSGQAEDGCLWMRSCERLGRAQACVRTLDRLAHQFVSHGDSDRDAPVQREPPPCPHGHQGVALSAGNPEVPPVVCTSLSRPGKAGVHFGGRQSLPHPEVMLDKQRLHGGRFSETEFRANDSCGLPCPPKRAGLDHKSHLVRKWRPRCTAPCGVFMAFRVTE